MRRLVVLLLLLSLALAIPSFVLGAKTPKAAVLIAAGDIAECDDDGDEATAKLVASQPGTVAVLGDAVYDDGTETEFRECYEPTWGKFKARTRAALGNHEYESPAAAPARAYFGLPDRGWYGYKLGAWQVVVLNSNCGDIEGGCGRGSLQWNWLRKRLSFYRAKCTLAYWHHPRWSSSSTHGSSPFMHELWKVLAANGADIVLAGHDHTYERFAPIDGIRSFVVGTGGKSHYPIERQLPGSQVFNTETYGVLRLDLRAADYSWRFLPIAGKTFTDSGSGLCR
jgi:hypothetical protein